MSPAIKLLLARARTMKAGEPVPSPCMSICRMDAVTELCEGCLRTLDEVAAWSVMDEAEKREVWKSIQQRATA